MRPRSIETWATPWGWCKRSIKGGEQSSKKEEKSDTRHKVERSSSKFLIRFQLLKNVKVEGLKVAMENQVLTVMMPKEEVKKADVGAIKIFG
ncbi:hypothetical protein ACLOJK_013735 [Asimina triloba]